VPGRPQESGPHWEIGALVDVLNLDPIGTFPAQATIPAKEHPHEAQAWHKTTEEPFGVGENLPNAPFLRGRPLPDLFLAQAIQHGKDSYTLGIK
jgi:hypothetical protein